MQNCLLVGIGGFCGAMLRYLLSLVPLPASGSFPIHTGIINILGSFAIGVIFALSGENQHAPQLVLLLQVGICGGFTTFSTFSLDLFKLAQYSGPGLAILYAALCILLCAAATWLGISIAR